MTVVKGEASHVRWNRRAAEPRAAVSPTPDPFEPKRDARTRRPPLLIWILAVALAGIAAAFAFAFRPKPAVTYVTVPLVRKTLVSFVTATGTVNPQNIISVGTQVSGTISSIVADCNDRLREGQVLARIDPTLLQAALERALGTLSQARSQWQAARTDAGAATSNSLAAYASADAICARS